MRRHHSRPHRRRHGNQRQRHRLPFPDGGIGVENLAGIPREMMGPHHLQQSVDRTLAGLKKMRDDAVDEWPRLQRERSEREHHRHSMPRRHMHHSERTDNQDERSSVEAPKAAGAGLHFNLFNGLFDGYSTLFIH